MLPFLAEISTPTPAPEPLSNAAVLVLQGFAALMIAGGGVLWCINQAAEMKRRWAKQQTQEKPRDIGPQPFEVTEHKPYALQEELNELSEQFNGRMQGMSEANAEFRKETREFREGIGKTLSRVETLLGELGKDVADLDSELDRHIEKGARA
jgi:hypothetical protein